MRRSRKASAGLWNLNPSESQVDRRESEAGRRSANAEGEAGIDRQPEKRERRNGKMRREAAKN